MGPESKNKPKFAIKTEDGWVEVGEIKELDDISDSFDFSEEEYREKELEFALELIEYFWGDEPVRKYLA